MKTWEKTKEQNMVRHGESGRYYARTYANGKEVWKSLRTAHFSVAKARLAEFLREHREKQAPAISDASAKMTFAEALKLHKQRLEDDVTLKPTTRHYWSQIFTSLLKTWPGLGEREVRRISRTDCDEWARKFRKVASSTRYNNTLSGLRHVLDVAVEAGVIYANPAAKLERVPVRQKQLTLPSRKEFLAMVESIEKAGAWCSRDCADFVRGLAFTGTRKSEAAEMEWRDIDFEAGEIVVRGDPETGTKNWTVRRVPLIADARDLFQRMREARHGEAADAKVFRVNEAQKAIDNAAKKLRIPRITHHDLRHLFATMCIESKVDIPTVANWLGHKDGGVLAMRTYGHLRREHSMEQAKMVRFDTVATTQAPTADVIPFLAAV
jgi:integrase